MQDFPYEIGDIISTPDLIGGVAGILVEVEKLDEPDDTSCLNVTTSFAARHHQNTRTHRIKLAIIQSCTSAFKPGEVCDFWPPQGATWKKW
tara:strand:+ start:957 stop:1229 length:273 start_codon:yes stop_codon:yes gene_type:complete